MRPPPTEERARSRQTPGRKTNTRSGRSVSHASRSARRPDVLVVRGVEYFIRSAPLYWRDTHRNHELVCDRCGQPLVVLFGARERPGLTPQNAAWWRPTAITCACLLPATEELIELPRRPHRPKGDTRQLNLL
jgi:hypothetical protein